MAAAVQMMAVAAGNSGAAMLTCITKHPMMPMLAMMPMPEVVVVMLRGGRLVGRRGRGVLLGEV